MQPEPWAGSTWGFWWIFPVIWSVICFFFVIVMARMASGARFERIRPHHEDREEAARLSHEGEERKWTSTTHSL